MQNGNAVPVSDTAPDTTIDDCRNAGHLLESYRISGEEELFERFHSLLFPRLIRDARAIAGNGRIDPEEAASLALASVFFANGRYRYRGHAAFQAWLRVILINTVRKIYRLQARHRSLERVPEPADRGAGDPARIYAQREEGRFVRRAYGLIAVLCWLEVDGLEREERAALIRHHCRGETFRQIGSGTGQPEARVAGKIRRARERVCRSVLRILSRWH
jgi:DNA-directed RNA polymerase specialized sigma24 family protein